MTEHDRPAIAADLLSGFAAGTISPVDVAQATLDRIDEENPRYSVFLSVDREGALAAAREAEQRWARWRQENTYTSSTDWETLPTWGVPVSVKDTIEQEGLPTTYGSLAFRDNHQPDAHVVEQLRAAGCVLVGKTNTAEFALSTVTQNRLADPARNPLDPSRSAGGSSGGAAAAAALGIGSFALGTDGAGSIRLPASYCGLFGFKPTFERIPVRQKWRASPLRSHLGPLANSWEDLAFAWKVLTGDHDPITPLDQGASIRVGLAAGDPDFRTVLDEAVSAIQASPAFELPSDPLTFPELPRERTQNGDWVFAGDHLAGAERMKPDFWNTHGHELTSYAQPIYDAGRRIPAWEYRLALETMKEFNAGVQEAFNDVDILLTSSTDLPPVLEDNPEDTSVGIRYELLTMWNQAGNPALAIPLPGRGEAIPRSIQLVGRRGEDRLVLQAALTLINSWRSASA